MLTTARTLKTSIDEWQIALICERHTFTSGHIPGAIWIDPNDILITDTPPDPAQCHKVLSNAGLDNTRPTLVVDEGQGLWAGRLYWMLSWLGYQKLCYLDGGLVQWLKLRYPIQDGRGIHHAPVSQQWVLDEGCYANVETVLESLQQDVQIWDSRTQEEYSGYVRRSRRAGRIPGALHYEWSNMLAHGSGLLRPLNQIEDELLSVGLHKDIRTVVYCQRHMRSSFAFMVAKIIGFKDIAGYLGSWHEWGNIDNVPVARDIEAVTPSQR